VVAYVISGVGFLGAGAIMKDGAQVSGLNTAATLWGSAAVGACAGIKLLPEAVLAAVFVLAANTLLRPVVNRIQRQPLPEAFSEATYAINVVCQREQQAEVLDQLLLLLEQAQYPVRAVDQRPFGERDVEIEAVLYATTVMPANWMPLATLATTPGVLQGFWNASLRRVPAAGRQPRDLPEHRAVGRPAGRHYQASPLAAQRSAPTAREPADQGRHLPMAALLSFHPTPGAVPMPSLSPRRPLVLLALIVVMAAIFLIDTVTDYAVAAACFYAAVILAARACWRARADHLAIACIALTGLSFFLTRFGTYRIGLVNSVIGMLVIGITTYLALNMEAAKAAVQEAQGRLLRVARASTVGELTTSIAHEVNQPLAAIASSAEACQRWLAQDPPNVDKARQTVARILADAHRAGDVIARIRGLTQGAAPERRAFDLNQAVEEMLALSRSELDQHGVAVALLLDADLPPVQADRVQVQQVIGNLILNAVDAMEASAAADRRLSLLTRRDGQRVSLSVRDRGVGLPADHPERVFDAFWTTKHGLGLGLSLSRSMIEANDGQIRAERPAGGGACFVFDLPIATDVQHA
jgi:signal transduction histidine kinase